MKTFCSGIIIDGTSSLNDCLGHYVCSFRAPLNHKTSLQGSLTSLLHLTSMNNSTPAQSSQFAAQSTTAEDLLRAQTVGLVKLDDFRKRRAEVLELKEREARDASARGSRVGTPATDGSRTPRDG